MSFVDVRPSMVRWPASYASGLSAVTVNVDQYGFSWSGHAWEALSIRHIGFLTGSVTQNGNLRASLQTVAANTSVPSGTFYATSPDSEKQQDTTAANTIHWFDLGQAFNITKDDRFAIVVQRIDLSGSGITPFDGQLKYSVSFEERSSWPRIALNTTGSWTANIQNTPLIGVKDGSGNMIALPNAALPSASTDRKVTTAGHRAGARFKLPFAAKCAGVRLYSPYNLNSTVGAKAYTDGGSAITGTTIGFGATDQDDSSQGPLWWETPFEIVAGTYYRVAFDATMPSAWPCLDYNTEAEITASIYGADWRYTNYNGTSWDDTIKSVPPFCLELSHLDDGAGGGGGARVLQLGGGI